VTLVIGLADLLAACTSDAPASVAPGGSGPAGSPRSNSIPTISSVRQVHVTISDAGCAPQALQLPSGPTTFIVTNSDSASVLEYEIKQGDRIIGETENVVPGLDRSFTLNLKPGASAWTARAARRPRPEPSP
jgi:iron uptake system component EfeO